MEKYKVCPNCGQHNNPIFIECAACETDLMGVKVVDESTENMNTVLESEKVMVRICDCGEQNNSSLRKCAICGEDISDIIPTEKLQCSEIKSKYTLNSIDDRFSFEIKNDVCIIGREHEMGEYLCDKSYVSRVHAKITIVNAELYITNLSTTNFTYVNNQKISDDMPVLINAGDEIGLGGLLKNGERQGLAAYFIVRVN